MRSCDLPECDIVRRADGIAVTTPPRTAFDAAWTLSNDDLESLIEHGIHRGYFTLATLWALGRRLAPARPAGQRSVPRGARRTRPGAIGRSSPTTSCAWSGPSAGRGFPRARPPVPAGDRPGPRHPPRPRAPEVGFFVEVDHLTWHGGRLATDYDCQRDLEIEALGHHVERVTDVAIDRHLGATVEALWTIYQRLLRS